MTKYIVAYDLNILKLPLNLILRLFRSSLILNLLVTPIATVCSSKREEGKHGANNKLRIVKSHIEKTSGVFTSDSAQIPNCEEQLGQCV